MRRRKYVPEFSGTLEGRKLLAGLAGTPGHPIPLRGYAFDGTLARFQADFQEYGVDRNFPRLRMEIQRIVGGIPFGKVDGLGPRINAIISPLPGAIASGATAPVNAAYQATLKAIGEVVVTRIAAGDLTVK